MYMKKYANLSHRSGIDAYQLASDHIQVRFTSGKTFTYSYTSAGKQHIEQMKKLAVAGTGLNTYINKYVKDLYE